MLIDNNVNNLNFGSFGFNLVRFLDEWSDFSYTRLNGVGLLSPQLERT